MIRAWFYLTMMFIGVASIGMAQDLGESGLLLPLNVNFVNGCVNSSSTLTTNCTLSVTSGNVLTAVSKTQNSSGIGTPVFTNTGTSCTGGWIRAVPATSISTLFPGNATVYTCLASTTASSTVTITWSGTSGAQFTDLSVSQWSTSAAWNTPVLDRATTNANTTSTTSCPTGSFTTVNNVDLMLAICENFNQAETWGALTGWTNQATASRNTVGLYNKTTSTAGSQSATIPLSTADGSQGILLALQASNVTTCSTCTLVQSANSAGETPNYDHIALSGVVPGDTLVYYVFHNNWSGSGTTTMSDSNGNYWYPCNTNTGGGTSVTMTDLQIDASNGMSCFYSIAVSQGGTVTGMPTASDCSVSCSFVGGVFMEFSGVHAWEAFSHTSSGTTSTSGSNNTTCGSLTTTTTNDLVICGIDNASGTMSAGTSPITFSALFNTTNGAMEEGIWPSSGTTSLQETLSTSGISYGGMGLAFR